MKQKLLLMMTLLLTVCSGAWAQTTLSTSIFYQTYANSNTSASDLITAASFPTYITTTINSNQNGTLSSIPSITTPHDFSQLNTSTKYYRLKTGSKAITITNVANLKKVFFYGNGSSSTRNITTAVTKISGSGSAFTVANITGISNSSATIAEYSTVDFSAQTGYDNGTFYTYVFTFSGDVALWGIYLEAGTATTSYNIKWENGDKGTAPESPKIGSTFTLPTMDAVTGYTNTGWTADQTVKVAGEDVSSGTEIAVGTSVTLTAATTFTGVWKKNSTFALESDEEVEVTTTSQISTTGAAGTVTYESRDLSIATVSASGLITAMAPGKTTITVTDPGTAAVAGGSATVTVLVPYEAVAADSYVFKIGNYKFANNDNTKYYFDNGFTMTVSNGAECQYASLESNTGIKYSHARQYTINVPGDVAITYAVIKARSNYDDETNHANWGTVFGIDYSATNLPQKSEEPAEKDFVVASPSAGASLTFQPGGNQIQAIITLYTIAYHEKYTVSFDAGDGTGSMDDVEVRGGSVYTLPASTFTAPSGKFFDGWLCSVDGAIYTTGASYNMTDAATTFTAQYGGVEGKSIIKVKLNGGSSTTVTGAIGGTTDVSVQSGSGKDIDGGWKLGSDGHYVGFTLADSYTLLTGDIIDVHVTNAASGKIIFYNDKVGTTTYWDTNEGASVGSHKFTVGTELNGKGTIYLVRKSGSNFNPYIDYIEVVRPDIITLNSSGFATYSRKRDFEIYSGATAYAMALDIENSTLTGTAIDGAIPAGAGVLLKGETGASVSIVETTDAAALTGNNLKGTTQADGTTATKGANTYYVLSGDTFVKFTGVSFTANKAYFEVSGSTDLSRLTMQFDDTTGISATQMSSERMDSAVYDLSGRKVAQPTKGLYIMNGKKVVIK